MIEKEKGPTKEVALREIVKHVQKAEEDIYSEGHGDIIRMADMFTVLAKDLGASDYEITEAWFSGENKEDRQDLLEVYCGKLWWDKDFGSFEKLQEWSETLIKIRNKFHLQDPLEIEAETPEIKTKDLKLSNSFINEKDRQSLFDLFSIKLKNDASFASLGDLKEWADEMLEIKTKYNLENPLKQERKSLVGFDFPNLPPRLDPNKNQRN